MGYYNVNPVVSEITLPDHLRRTASTGRFAYPAPMLGMPVVFTTTFPTSLAAVVSGSFSWRLPFSIRPLALGWYVNVTSGTSATLFMIRVATAAGSGTNSAASLIDSTVVAVSSSGDTIHLDATPSGVIYFTDLDAEALVLTGERLACKLDSTTEPSKSNEPEMGGFATLTSAAGPTADRVIISMKPTLSTTTLACASFWLMGWPTSHVNLNPGND